MGQKQVGRMIVPVIVVGLPHECLQEAANCKSPTKGLKEAQPPKAGEAAFFQGGIESPGTFAYTSQMYPMGSFVRSPYCLGETRCSFMVA